MTRNGRIRPFPNEFMTPPSCRSHTSRGSCGSNARSHFMRARAPAGAHGAVFDEAVFDEAVFDEAAFDEPLAGGSGRAAIDRGRRWRAGRRRREEGAGDRVTDARAPAEGIVGVVEPRWWA